MQRRLAVIGIVVALLCSVIVAPVAAQGDFTPEQQAALDEVRTAFDAFAAADTYTAAIDQQIDQTVTVTYQAQTVTLDQQIESTGTSQLEKMPDATYDNQQASLAQSVSQTIAGAGQDQQADVGPMQFDLIVVDDQIYMRMQMPENLAGTVPEGWQDVTNGADAFPGMNMFNIEQMMAMSGRVNAEYVSTLFDKAVTGIEILDPETVDGRTLNQYRLTLDPRVALEQLDSFSLMDMFKAGALPFDLEALFQQMFTDEDTRYTIDVTVAADDQSLVEYTVNMSIDLAIGPELITDQTLEGAEMTLVQDVVSSLRPSDLNQPVDISAPEVAG